MNEIVPGIHHRTATHPRGGRSALADFLSKPAATTDFGHTE